jgi:hypothetical protein
MKIEIEQKVDRKCITLNNLKKLRINSLLVIVESDKFFTVKKVFFCEYEQKLIL